ncbi:MAG: type I methionyl aminopeptidase [Anaerolineae bacterium]|jgi:methionyl aminopeptidase|nr:type I methionyl aminopeptidase [Anaerolineae bacterium]
MTTRITPVEGVEIYLKNAEELALMREAGRIVALAHQAMKAALRPGISTAELDKIAEAVIRDHGARPAFLGQEKPNSPRYPATITASVNEELVHGIPRPDRILKEGDIVSLDTGCFYQGFVGDSAWTYVVGDVRPNVQRLLDVTERALYVGIEASVIGNDLRTVARSIQQYIEKQGYGLAREYTGHGVGQAMWEDPQVPNWWPNKPSRNLRFDNVPLMSGMTYAIEPMVMAGRPDVKELDDKWTVVTKDKSLCAHFEHTIAITPDGPQIMTRL